MPVQYCEHNYPVNSECPSCELKELRRAVRNIFSCAFSITFNANDLFAPGCSEETTVSVFCGEESHLLELARRFGHYGIQAAISIAAKSEIYSPRPEHAEALAYIKMKGWAFEADNEKNYLRDQFERLKNPR